MAAYLEHANITVPDVDEAITFLATVDPSLRVRRDETPPGSSRWAHVGTDQSYIALQAPNLGTTPKGAREAYANYGINHLGWVVDNFDATIARLESAGYRRGMEAPAHPHRKRAYYYDSAGLEWEILEYLSRDPREYNDYDA